MCFLIMDLNYVYLKLTLFFSSLQTIFIPCITEIMSRVCQITGKRPRSGNKVSHAHNKTKRKFYPNLQKKRFYIPEEDRWVTIKVAASTLRTINKNGISNVLKNARAKGTLTI